MIRFLPGLIPVLCAGALCAGCSNPAMPIIVSPPAPPVLVGDCRPFTAARMDNGSLHSAAGSACLQSDGTLRIVSEYPSPDAAIAVGTPVVESDPQAVTVYYPYDPSAHGSGFLSGYGDDGRWYDGPWHDGAFRHFHHRHHFLGRSNGFH